jgi:hypothetical protein
MPTYYTTIGNSRDIKAAKIKADLIAKGLDPRSNKFHEVFFRKMKKY